MHADAPGALASLLTPSGAERFLRAHWSHTDFFAQTDRASWPEFLRMDAWSDPVRIQQLHPGPLQVTRGFISQYPVAGARLDAWIGDLGMACLLQDLHTTLPGAAAWLGALERELGVPAGAARLNAFVNPPGVGLGVHCDPREHLLIHVAGHKRIRLLANPAGRYVSASHSATCAPSQLECLQYPKGLPGWTRLPDDATEHLLVPGSVLWMPRGTYHETQGEGDAVSTSLVVQLDLPSHADALLSYLRLCLVQDERWRAPLVSAAPHEREATLRTLLCELGRRLPELDVTRMLGASDPASAAGLARAERYVRNPSAHVSILARDDGARLLQITRACGRGRSERIALGEDALGLVVELCAIAEPIERAQLEERFTDWDARSLEAMIAFLVRHEVFVVLHAERCER
jgi:hypothetical protein